MPGDLIGLALAENLVHAGQRHIQIMVKATDCWWDHEPSCAYVFVYVLAVCDSPRLEDVYNLVGRIVRSSCY